MPSMSHLCNLRAIYAAFVQSLGTAAMYRDHPVRSRQPPRPNRPSSPAVVWRRTGHALPAGPLHSTLAGRTRNRTILPRTVPGLITMIHDKPRRESGVKCRQDLAKSDKNRQIATRGKAEPGAGSPDPVSSCDDVQFVRSLMRCRSNFAGAHTRPFCAERKRKTGPLARNHHERNWRLDRPNLVTYCTHTKTTVGEAMRKRHHRRLAST
jgi:hypothetical protein